MRILVLTSLLLVAACGVEGNVVAGAANVVALPVLGRTVPDAVYSAVTGNDCSMVNLEQGKPWCRTAAPPPPTAPFCTRSLGVVDCWASAAEQPMPARPGVADGPTVLTRAQEKDRTTGWLGHRLPTPDDPPGH